MALYTYSSNFNPVLDPDPATMAMPIDINSSLSFSVLLYIVRFLSKSSIECSVSMSDCDIVEVGLICNRMVHTVVFGINSTRNAVRKCEIALGYASHFFTLPELHCSCY